METRPFEGSTSRREANRPAHRVAWLCAGNNRSARNIAQPSDAGGIPCVLSGLSVPMKHQLLARSERLEDRPAWRPGDPAEGGTMPRGRDVSTIESGRSLPLPARMLAF